MPEYAKSFQEVPVLRLRWMFLALILPSCVTSQPADQLASVMSPEQQTSLLNADVILLGEQHDNPHHHALQKEVLDLLGQRSVLGSVVFEQVHWDQQGVLNALNNRSLGELAKDLNWASSGWPDYKFYEPLFMAATRYKAQLIAGNIAPQKSKVIYQDGYAAIFTPDEQKKLGLDQKFEPKAEAALEEEIFVGHCRLLPKDHVKTMIPVQRSRDAAMALAWSRLHKKGKTVFIVGSGHARKDFGIPWYLERLKPGIKIYSVGMNEEGADTDAGVYDQVITTKAAEREDPCAGLKDKFSKPAKG
jgi:uncharacterized iron-regulated protein